VLALYSPDGLNGSLCCSGSADEKLRVWDMKDRTISKAIPFARPTDDRLMKYRNMAEDSLPRFSASNQVVEKTKPDIKKDGDQKLDDNYY
jgi:WD40 repeat protein